jgi:hypothetical protein
MEAKKFKINNSYESPQLLDFSILGLHKKRTIVTGELRIVEYFNEFDGTTYSDLVVRENRTYHRNSIGLVQYRTLFVEWFMNDDTLGTTTTTLKYYSPTESIDEGIERRKNVIANAKIYCLNTIGQTYAFDLLISLKTYIDIYTEGYKAPLIGAVNASTKPYLTSDIKTVIIGLLTFE